MGPVVWRMALVTSSLTTRVVVGMTSGRFQAVSWRMVWARAWATTAGSAGRSQEATWPAVRVWVRASRTATSSSAAGRSGSRVASM